MLPRVLGTGLAFTVMLFAVEVGLGHAVAFLFITGWLAVALAERHGLTWIWLPMPNANYPEGEVDARLRTALPELSRLLDQGAHIVIHCSASVHRTGMVAYGLLRWRGYSPRPAFFAFSQPPRYTAKRPYLSNNRRIP